MNNSDKQTGQAGDSERTSQDAPSSNVENAAVRDGGIGGRSGTGQAHPHHGVEDRAEPDPRIADAADGDDIIPVGSSYQSGGTQEDRAQRDQELKQRDGGAGVASSPQGGADPAPGAEAVRSPVDR